MVHLLRGLSVVQGISMRDFMPRLRPRERCARNNDVPASPCARRVMSLCSVPKLFVESRDQFRDVRSDPHSGHADQRTFDVVPQLERLLPGVDPVARDGPEIVFGGRVERLPRRRRAEDRRQECTAGNRPSEEQVRSCPELLGPIGGAVDPIFQFSEVGAESFWGPIDLRLYFYFVGCFIHSRFSWSDSIVRSGMGLIRANLRSPAVTTTPPTPAIATAVTSVAAHIGRTVARA